MYQAPIFTAKIIFFKKLIVSFLIRAFYLKVSNSFNLKSNIYTFVSQLNVIKKNILSFFVLKVS